MTTETLNSLNIVLGFGAIILQIICLIVIFLFFFHRQKKTDNFILLYIKKNFLVLGFIISVCALLLTMFYSEVVGFVPCSLCWYQRIFMFPIVFLFCISIYTKDNNVIKYIAPLGVIGFGISLYQNYFYYFGNSSTLPCDASGVSCYQKLISEFGGYISFPMFALTVFLAILVLVSVAYFYKQEKSN